MARSMLIKGGWVLTMDAALGDFRQADVLVDGGRIAAVAPAIGLGTASDVDVIDAAGMIVAPGFVDSHRHTWEALVRNVGADWSLPSYLQNIYYGNLGARLRPDDLYAGNLLGALEALDAGVTTILDWSMLYSPEHGDAAVRSLQESGIRAVFACGLSGEGAYWGRDSKLPHPRDAQRLARAHFSSRDQLLTLGLAIRGPEFSHWDAAVDDIAFARDLGALCSMHLGFGTWGAADRSIEKLQRAGCLGPDLNVVHGNAISPEELRMAADHGVSISVTPEIEMMMGHGYPITGAVLAAGGRPALGVDVVTSTGGDMFTQMKFALQAERARCNEATLAGGNMPMQLALSAREVLSFATLDAARALQLDSKVGSLTPGKQADIVLIRATDLNLFPVNDAVGALVQCATTANVDSVFVAGVARKRGGRLVGVDLERVRRLALTARDHVFTPSAASTQ